jgi:uncharacterized small protein (DUF1192 family)
LKINITSLADALDGSSSIGAEDSGVAEIMGSSNAREGEKMVSVVAVRENIKRITALESELALVKEHLDTKKATGKTRKAYALELETKLAEALVKVDETSAERFQLTINRLNLELTDYKLKLNRTIEDSKAREQELMLNHDFQMSTEIEGLKKRLSDLTKRLRVAEAKHVED